MSRQSTKEPHANRVRLLVCANVNRTKKQRKKQTIQNQIVMNRKMCAQKKCKNR